TPASAGRRSHALASWIHQLRGHAALRIVGDASDRRIAVRIPDCAGGLVLVFATDKTPHADELAGRAGLLGPRRGDRRERNCGDCFSSIPVRPSYNSSWRGPSCPPRPQSCRRVFESRTKTSAGTIAGAADGIAGATALLQKLRAQLPILLQHSKI